MIPLFKPYMPELPNIESILFSGSLAYGTFTKEFESKLKKFFETEYLIVTNSFNTAISVALTSLGLVPGNSVIASPMACLASTQPYLSSGMRIQWADIDPLTGTLSPDSVEKKVNNETKAIVHNHYCGYPGFIDEINEIGIKYGIPVIDDGIECFGTEYKGKKIGNCGTDVTVFSLTAVRFCNCIDGGIVIFKDEELYKKSLLIRDCGIDRKLFRDEIGEINPNCDIKLIGYSATMSNVNGYIGLKQMENIDDLLIKHREQASKWSLYLEGNSSVYPLVSKDGWPNYWVYGVLAKNKRTAIESFRKQGFYASGVHIRNDIYSVFGSSLDYLSGVETFYKQFVALPCGWWMS